MAREAAEGYETNLVREPIESQTPAGAATLLLCRLQLSGVIGDENATTEVITLPDSALGTKLFWHLRIELMSRSREAGSRG